MTGKWTIGWADPTRFTYDDGGRSAAGYRGDAGDCVTRAIAIATGLPYQEVYDSLHVAIKGQRLLRARKRSPRDGVPKRVTRKYLEALGWKFTPTMSIGSGCRVHLRREELPPGRIIAQVSRHMVAVIDGMIRDTHDPSRAGTRCVYGYWSKP